VISLILARAANGAIGRRGALPWRLPEDMRRFKAVTWGKPCIMGRKTWESLPGKFRPLPGRANIVLTRNLAFAAEGACTVHSLDEAFAADAPEVMVIGGAALYAAALPQAGRIYLTEVHVEIADGDVFLPPVSPRDWREIAREDRVASGGPTYSFVTLERIPLAPSA